MEFDAAAFLLAAVIAFGLFAVILKLTEYIPNLGGHLGDKTT